MHHAKVLPFLKCANIPMGSKVWFWCVLHCGNIKIWKHMQHGPAKRRSEHWSGHSMGEEYTSFNQEQGPEPLAPQRFLLDKTVLEHNWLRWGRESQAWGPWHRAGPALGLKELIIPYLLNLHWSRLNPKSAIYREGPKASSAGWRRGACFQGGAVWYSWCHAKALSCWPNLVFF